MTKKKKSLPFNKCQINKTIRYSANRPVETTVMFNVRENDPKVSARLFQELTDEYYRAISKAKAKRKITDKTKTEIKD